MSRNKRLRFITLCIIPHKQSQFLNYISYWLYSNLLKCTPGSRRFTDAAAGRSKETNETELLFGLT